jgi:uroporphyrinogen decarboxylase
LIKILFPYLGLETGLAGDNASFAKDLDLTARKLGIDFRPISSDPPVGFRKKAVFNPLFQNAWGVQVAPNLLEDEWGIQRELTATGAQSRIIKHPLKGITNLDDYAFPDPQAAGRFESVERRVKTWQEEYAVVARGGGDGFFLQGWYLRGFEDLILDMHSNSRFVDQLFDQLLEFYLSEGKRLAELGADIYVVSDDVAMQTGPIISPGLWRRFVKPRLSNLISALKQTGMYIMYHSDGNLEHLIPDLIEIGIDGLNPIQPECMNPAIIKELYGDRICLSGTISMQETLPFGTIEDVRNEVKKRIATCASGGGFIICPSNRATIDISAEKFMTVYETAKKFGRYPSSEAVPVTS